MSRAFPLVSEFDTTVDPPWCPRDGRRGYNGCVVASTAAILARYQPDRPVTSLRKLGQSMGDRHRHADPTSCHGICPCPWCAKCAYLELKARFVPVGYGHLSIAQLRAHAKARHAMNVCGWYHEIHPVSPNAYSRTVVARGRSDRGNDDARFGHSIVVWEAGALHPDGRPATYIVSDPDLGSKARPAIPPYSEFDADELEAFYTVGKMSLAYCLDAPPELDAPKVQPPKGVTLRFGGELRSRGLYVAIGQTGARQRSSPYVRPNNVIRTVPSGTEFRCSQTTRAGTTVSGSSTWHGDPTGTVWMHHSVVRPKV